MKTMLTYLFLLVLPFGAQGATVYQWTDSKGVMHFTDDREKVPARYRDKVRERDLGPKESTPPPQPAPAAGSAAGGDSSAPTGRAAQERYGDHTAQWWQTRFNALRVQMAALQQSVSVKQQKLAELRRERTIFQRARDRVAENELNEEIDQDQAKYKALQEALANLELEASRAGVPAQWR